MTIPTLSDKDVDALLTARKGLSRYTRWVHAGHSYGALHPVYGQVLGSSGTLGGGPSAIGSSSVERQWVALVRDALALSDDSLIMGVTSTAVAGARDSILIVPEESFIQSVIYLPAGALTGANTNTRELELTLPLIFGGPTIARVQFDSGVSLATATQRVLASMLYAGGSASPPFADGTGASLQSFTLLHLLPGLPVLWRSLVVGTGLADPGGTVIIKLASSYWNIAVGASKLAQEGIYQGGFATVYAASPLPRHPGVPVALSVAASASATSITVDALLGDIPSGSVLAFSNGVTATTTALAAALATTISVSALSGSIAKGETAHHRPAAAGGYEGQGAVGSLWTFNWGVNEQPAQRESWRQSIHAVTAWARSPSRRAVADPLVGLATQRNMWQYAAGNGAAAAWALVTPSAPCPDGLTGYMKFTGAVGGTKPTAIRKVEPSFEGGSFAIGFLALVGNTKGAAATITVDGATPPQGVVTISTHNIGTGLGTLVPMVKILTGLSAGAHTITITIDSIDATDGSAQFLLHWDGPIGLNPANEVRWLNVARVPSGAMSDADVALFNTDLANVLAGTATPPSGNSTEPGHGARVKIVDIDTVLAKSTANFDGVGTHPNDRGHLLVGDAVILSTLDAEKQPALAR